MAVICEKHTVEGYWKHQECNKVPGTIRWATARSRK